MGNYNCRKPGFLSALNITICEHVFQGKSNEWIIEHDYEVDMNDEDAIKKAKKRLSALKRNPKFIEYYNSIVTEFRVHGYGKAMHTIVDALDDPNVWARLQAANLVLSKTEKIVTGEEENKITVVVEGMPEMGSPDSESLENQGYEG